MKYSTPWLFLVAACMLAGCVTTDGQGGKPIKQEDPEQTAAKIKESTP